MIWLLALACSDYEIQATDKVDEPIATDTEVEVTETESDPTETEDTEEPVYCDDSSPDGYEVTLVDECSQEPEIGTFTPVVEWNWTTNSDHAGYDHVMSAPVAGQLDDDDGDGDIDEDDIPDIVFTAFTSNQYRYAGALIAIDGSDGSQKWSVRTIGSGQPYGCSGVAVADLDGSGDPVILVVTSAGLAAVEADGTERWTASIPSAPDYGMGHPAVADIDGDGTAEIALGPYVYDADGNLLWSGTGHEGSSRYMSFFYDLDDDGTLELIAGGTIYESDGTIRSTTGYDGFAAVGDLDGDGKPEVVNAEFDYSQVRAIDDDGTTTLWTTTLSDGGGGPPTIADFDGDGEVEVGVAAADFYRVLEGSDGTLLWKAPTDDNSSKRTGSSVFDFEGDGAAEVVYADEETLWVYDGATGTVELEYTDHASGTLFEYPLVVDVDQDGSAEIVTAANDYARAGNTGIYVIGDKDDSWVAARTVWNQHAYHITNVEDDGSIPSSGTSNIASWNSFRAGNSETKSGLEMPDLTVAEPEVCTDECASDRIVVFWPVENQGDSDVSAVDVSLYAVDGADWTLIDVQSVPVDGGESYYMGPLYLQSSDFGPDGILLSVDDDGNGNGAIDECDEDNQTWSIDAWPCD